MPFPCFMTPSLGVIMCQKGAGDEEQAAGAGRLSEVAPDAAGGQSCSRIRRTARTRQRLHGGGHGTCAINTSVLETGSMRTGLLIKSRNKKNMPSVAYCFFRRCRGRISRLKPSRECMFSGINVRIFWHMFASLAVPSVSSHLGGMRYDPCLAKVPGPSVDVQHPFRVRILKSSPFHPLLQLMHRGKTTFDGLAGGSSSGHVLRCSGN